jgi:hypothetical protein
MNYLPFIAANRRDIFLGDNYDDRLWRPVSSLLDLAAGRAA